MEFKLLACSSIRSCEGKLKLELHAPVMAGSAPALAHCGGGQDQAGECAVNRESLEFKL